MEITTTNYEEHFYHSKILDPYFKDLKIGIFDIETTGLYAEKNNFILGGLLTSTLEGTQCIQCFAETKKEESRILEHYSSLLSDLDVFISYNGNGFDFPFLKKRCEKMNIPFDFFSCQSFDLYQALNKHSNLRKLLPNLKQKTVENFMGLWTHRIDEISGKESVEQYEEYLLTHNPDTKDLILLHNKDDLLQLSRLMAIVKKLDFHKIMFHNGFVLSHEDKRIYIEKIQLLKTKLLVHGSHRNMNLDYNCFQSSHEASFSKESKKFRLTIPLIFEANSVFVDLEEFSMDCSVFEKYGGYQSGYLILQNESTIYYGEINLLIKTILQEIARNF